jgi:hypothetical protein
MFLTHSLHLGRRRWTAATLAMLGAVLILAATSMSGASRRFYADDPLTHEPEKQDASRAAEWDIDLFLDLIVNLFGRPGDKTPDVRARNINTIDEVADSSWFTNRIFARPVSIAEAVRGPLTSSGPAPGTWSVVRPKLAGFAPGFTMKDAAGETWFVSFDARGYPEAATGAILVANKIFWTLGYWQIENHLVAVHPDSLAIDAHASVVPPSKIRRLMKRNDLDEVFRRAHRSADGSYRAVAARAAPGRVLGGFQYHGTRPDDPNDIVLHEHRRELRALKVFGAWTNLVDMKAGNTLDTVTTENGRSVVRHYLQDVGSTFGTGANAPREYDEGWEYLYEGSPTWKRLVSLGFHRSAWLRAKYDEQPAIGRFEGETFDPLAWKPRVATAAILRARGDDCFWAAQRVMAFSDDLIRAIVKTGHYSDPRAEQLLADVLIQRRDKIGRAYLPAINPLVNFALGTDGRLTFENAAVNADVAKVPAGGYLVRWSRFDNATGEVTPIGEPTSTAPLTTGLSVSRTAAAAAVSPVAGEQARAPGPLPASVGAFVKLEVHAIDAFQPSWAIPVDVYFRRTISGWKLVGLERLP